ncbi:MAG: endolytic transglycosylase MltG [Elusimicrobiota bacterium]
MLRRIIVTCLAVFMVATLFWWFSLSAKQVIITIEKGSTAKQAAAALENSGLISSKKVFLGILKISGKSQQIKAGTYSIAPRYSVFGIISMITGGKTVKEKITVPEGFTARQIAAMLAGKGMVDEYEFTKITERDKLEGYLFPETYFYETGATESQIIKAMTDEFKKHFNDDLKSRAKELRMTERQVVTLASIIEKEAARGEERPLISGVFHNRMKKGWFLESCATIIYALGKHKEKLTNKDLLVKSPYNTYRNYGLPPGPICNPGIESIRAALYPAQTDDMFFVVNGEGTHSFSRYYDDHLKNKRKNRQNGQ